MTQLAALRASRLPQCQQVTWGPPETVRAWSAAAYVPLAWPPGPLPHLCD